MRPCLLAAWPHPSGESQPEWQGRKASDLAAWGRWRASCVHQACIQPCSVIYSGQISQQLSLLRRILRDFCRIAGDTLAAHLGGQGSERRAAHCWTPLHVLTSCTAAAAVHRAADDASIAGELGIGCCAGASVSLTAPATAMAAGGCRRQAWAAVLALAVLAACSAASGASAQVVGVDVTNSTLVFTSEGFAQALQASNIHTILISCESAAAPVPAPVRAACSCMQGSKGWVPGACQPCCVCLMAACNGSSAHACAFHSSLVRACVVG